MRVDIVHFIRTQTSISQCSVHRIGRTCAFRIRRCQMRGVGRLAITQDFTQNHSSAFERKFTLFKNQNSCTFRQHKSVSIPIKRTAGLLWCIIAS